MTSPSATSLRVLLDENVDRQVCPYVEREGHDAVHVVDVLEPGVDDTADIAPYARKTDRIVVTKDTDFLSMDTAMHAGVFFLANHSLDAFEIATTIIAVGEAVSTREDVQDVLFLDDWR